MAKVKRPITQLTFHGIQIKSLECFKAFADSVSEIEERCGVHEVEITLSNIFFLPVDKHRTLSGDAHGTAADRAGR